jgi:hypothetical protein
MRYKQPIVGERDAPENVTTTDVLLAHKLARLERFLA